MCCSTSIILDFCPISGTLRIERRLNVVLYCSERLNEKNMYGVANRIHNRLFYSQTIHRSATMGSTTKFTECFTIHPQNPWQKKRKIDTKKSYLKYKKKTNKSHQLSAGTVNITRRFIVEISHPLLSRIVIFLHIKKGKENIYCDINNSIWEPDFVHFVPGQGFCGWFP